MPAQYGLWEPGWLVGKSTELLIQTLRVRIPAGAAGEFSSPEVLTLTWCPFHPHVTAVARKRPFCQKCRWHVTAKHAWPNEVAVGWLCRWSGIVWSLSGNGLTHYLSGKTQPQSSQLTEPLWTHPCIKSGICVRELICTLQWEAKRGMIGRTFSPNPRKWRKSHHSIVSGIFPHTTHWWHVLDFPAAFVRLLICSHFWAVRCAWLPLYCSIAACLHRGKFNVIFFTERAWEFSNKPSWDI